MKTNDTSASKSTPAGMNPGDALQAADAVALRDHRAALPKAAELPVLDGTEFHVIKRYEPKADGYRFLHGVALAWHQDRLFASFGHNKGGENTDTEEARFCTSADGGRTWSHVATIDPGESHRNAALSYPCAKEHQGKLYVGYSNNGGNVGRIGEGRELWNNNSAELAIIPVEKLKVRP